MKELDCQKKVIDIVKQNGGWGAKWDSKHKVGVPDLILSHPSFGTIFVEVKLTDITDHGVIRTVPTPIQVATIDRILASRSIVLIIRGVRNSKKVSTGVFEISDTLDQIIIEANKNNLIEAIAEVSRNQSNILTNALNV
jgi:hypothetical protein